MRLITAVWAPALVSLVLAGCGGSDVAVNSTAANDTAAPTASISGAPPSSVAVGGNYIFTPTASDSDGRAMTFSIVNAPSWAVFSTTSGTLSGRPKSTDAGTTSGIVISVADGTAKASLPAFSITVSNTTPTTGSATLSWMAPTQNTNGTPLIDLAGYNIYFGTDASALTQTVHISNAAALSYVVGGLAAGTTWYFAVTSYTAAGEESAPSTVTSKTI